MVSSLPTTLSPPNDDPLLRLLDFLRLHSKKRKQRPNAIAAAPTPAITTPAICGLVRVGADAAAGAAVALAEEEMDEVERVGKGTMPAVGESVDRESDDEEEVKGVDVGADVLVVRTDAVFEDCVLEVEVLKEEALLED